MLQERKKPKVTDFGSGKFDIPDPKKVLTRINEKVKKDNKDKLKKAKKHGGGEDSERVKVKVRYCIECGAIGCTMGAQGHKYVWRVRKKKKSGK